jgi:hypothetical protein
MSYSRSMAVAAAVAAWLALEPSRAMAALCPPVPSSDCRPAASTRLKLNKGSTSARDKLRWSWRNSIGTAYADFGDPTVGTSYALCLYDGSAAAQPVLATEAPADSMCAVEECWEVYSANTVYLYVDGRHVVGGLALLKLKSPPGGTNLQAKGGGARLALPALPLTPPVRVQLHNSDTPTCWEATYTSAKRNDAVLFKAEVDAR